MTEPIPPVPQPYPSAPQPHPPAYAPQPGYAPPGYGPQPGYGPVGPPFAPAPRASVLAADREYHQALTGPGMRWWRPVVNLLSVLALGVVLMIGLGIAMVVQTLVQNGGDIDALESVDESAMRMDDPTTFTIQNLALASLILVVLAATWGAHQVRPGYASSVLGRFRWGWAAWCLALLVPLWGGFVVVASLLTTAPGGADEGGAAQRPEHWVALLVLTALTTPFQAAGEEYLFRGWVMQWFGSFIRHRWVSLGVAALVSATLFALAHGSFDVWLFLDLMAMALGMVIITWRTGGLEAAVVLHAVNNLIAIGYAILFGNLADSFIGTDSKSDPVATLVSAVAIAVAVAALWWLADRKGVARRTPREAVPA